MANRFLDSCGHYGNSQVLGKWSAHINGAINSTGGRRGGPSLTVINGYVQRLIDAQSTWIVGHARSIPSNQWSAVTLVALYDGSTLQCDCRSTATGAVTITRNGTVLGTSAAAVIPAAANTYFYLEFKATIASGTSGSAEVKINGTSVLSVTGVNTQNTANATADTVRLETTTGQGGCLFCDIYANDGTGSVNNTYWGDVKVEYLPPTADGFYTAWTPSTGTSHYALVNETTPNDDTNYNSTATTGNIDSFATGSATTGTIKAVQQIVRARVDDAGTHTLQQGVRISSTDYFGSSVTLAAGYAYYLRQLDQNPATTAAWVNADLGSGAAQIAVKMVT